MTDYHEYTKRLTLDDLEAEIDLDSLAHLSYGKRDPIEIVYELMITSSTNEKVEILKKALTNDGFREGLLMAYDHRVRFWQRKIPDYTPLRSPAEPMIQTITRLREISERRVTGNKAVEVLQQILQQTDPRGALFIELVVLKDLRCGINAGLIRKAVKNLIPKHPVMLASSMDKDALQNKWTYPCAADIKMDGTRCTVVYQNDIVSAYLRNGNLLEQVPERIEKILSKVSDVGFALDGELLVLEEHGSRKVLPRKKGNGIINKCLKGTASEDELSRVVFCVWDIIAASHFWRGISDTQLKLRRNVLDDFCSRFEELDQKLPRDDSALSFWEDGDASISFCPIFKVNTFIVNSHIEAQDLFNRVVEEGHEGLILKDLRGIWKDGRPKHQMKMKVENEIELIVRGVVEGTGKYKGKLGALVCSSEDGSIVCEVGTGFSDVEREELWNMSLEGKIVTVKHNGPITSEGRDTQSLYLPVFVELRQDL